MKQHSARAGLGVCLAAALAGAGCDEDDVFPSGDEHVTLQRLHSMPSRPPSDPTNRFAELEQAADLGRHLFNDPRFSACETVSCATCHKGEGLTVPEPTAEGCFGRRTGRNPPTLLNAVFNDFQNWDARADRQWSQAILPLTHPDEMAASPALVRARLLDHYADAYESLVGMSVSASSDDELLANFGKFVAAYERSLVRSRAPFDEDVKRFLAAVDAGKAEADPAYLGLKTFVRKGQCTACHRGSRLTDESLHNVGLADSSAGRRGAAIALPALFASPFNVEGPHSDERSGAATNRLANLERDLNSQAASFEGAFRTPSLRNVALTAPYMHTGSLATLEEVVDFYDRGGDAANTFVGKRTETMRTRSFTAEEKAALVRLMESMTGAK